MMVVPPPPQPPLMLCRCRFLIQPRAMAAGIFGICDVLRVPRPFGTCHALGALLPSWPKGQRVNWRQKRPFAPSHIGMGGSILFKVSLQDEQAGNACLAAAALLLAPFIIMPHMILATLTLIIIFFFLVSFRLCHKS